MSNNFVSASSFGAEGCYGAREVLGGLVGLPTNTRAVRDVILKLVPDLLDVVLAVKDASYNEKPPHAAAIALAEERGFEVLANGGATPEPRACRGL